MPWEESSAALVFEIMDENSTTFEPYKLKPIGTVRVPLKDLVAHEGKIAMKKLRGLQMHTCKWYNVHLHHETQARLLQEQLRPVRGGTSNDNDHAPVQLSARLLLRIQVDIEDDLSASSFDDEDAGVLALYRIFRAGLIEAAYVLKSTASALERAKNCLNWAHPRKTQMILYGLLVFFLSIWYLVPVKLVLILIMELPFFAILIPKEGGGPWKLGNFLSSVPDDVILADRKRHAPLEVPAHSLLRLERLRGAVCSGYLKHAETKRVCAQPAKWKWHFIAIDKLGVLSWWNSSVQARAGAAPEGRLQLRMSCCCNLLHDDVSRLHEQWLPYFGSRGSSEVNEQWEQKHTIRQAGLGAGIGTGTFSFFSIIGPFLHEKANHILAGDRMHFFAANTVADRKRWVKATSVFSMPPSSLERFSDHRNSNWKGQW